MKGLEMIGKLVGAALGGAVSKQKKSSPVAGAIIGAATMTVARRMLPARFAVLGAAVATGYVTRKLAQRAERREKLNEGVAPKPTTAKKKIAVTNGAAKATVNAAPVKTPEVKAPPVKAS